MRLRPLMPPLVGLASATTVGLVARPRPAHCADEPSAPPGPHPRVGPGAPAAAVPAQPCPPAPATAARLARGAPAAPAPAPVPAGQPPSPAPAIDAAALAAGRAAAVALGVSDPLEQGLYAALLAAAPPARRNILEQVGRAWGQGLHRERCSLATLRQLAALADEDLVAVGQLARASSQAWIGRDAFALPHLVEVYVTLPAPLRGLAAEVADSLPDTRRHGLDPVEHPEQLRRARLALRALRRHPHVDAEVCRRLWRQPDAGHALHEVVGEVAAAGRVDAGHLEAARARLRRLGHDPDACHVVHEEARACQGHGLWDVLLRAEATHSPALAAAIEALHGAAGPGPGSAGSYCDLVVACGRCPAAHVLALAQVLRDRPPAAGAPGVDGIAALLALPPLEADALVALLGARGALSQAALWAAVPSGLRQPLHALLAAHPQWVQEVAALPPQDAPRAARRGTQLRALACDGETPVGFWRDCLAERDEAAWERGVARARDWLGARRVSAADALRLQRVLGAATVPLPSGEAQRKMRELGDEVRLLEAWCALDPREAPAALHAVAAHLRQHGPAALAAESPGRLLGLLASYERAYREF